MNPSSDITLGGASGWAGAGMLGLVLAWLLWKHIPRILDDNKEQILAHKDQISNLISKEETSRKEFSIMYERNLDKVLHHCHSEMDALSKLMTKELETLGTAINALTNAVKSDERWRIK
jgi:hypothetical protein